MVAWSEELSIFDIQYEPRTAIKAQALTNFLVDMVDKGEARDLRWMLYVDGASSTKGSKIDIIWTKKATLWSNSRLSWISWPLITKPEYEALITRLLLTFDVDATDL